MDSRALVAFTLLSSVSLAPRGSATEVGLAAGVSLVAQSDPDLAAVRPHLQGRVGWRVGQKLRLGIELARYGLFDERPLPSDFANGNNPNVLGVTAVMLTAQFGREGGVYVRPCLGLTRQDFPGYYVPGPGDESVSAEVSHEGSPAIGVAVGKELWRAGGARLALEGLGLLSAGEDSSSARRMLGLQLVSLWGR